MKHELKTKERKVSFNKEVRYDLLIYCLLSDIILYFLKSSTMATGLFLPVTSQICVPSKVRSSINNILFRSFHSALSFSKCLLLSFLTGSYELMEKITCLYKPSNIINTVSSNENRMRGM